MSKSTTDQVPPGRWECPKCGSLLETMIPTNGPPLCSRHTGGIVPFITTTKKPTKETPSSS